MHLPWPFSPASLHRAGKAGIRVVRVQQEVSMKHRKLTTYEGATGFILDWMITGFFPNGTVCDHDPDLYEPKASRFWKHDYLSPYGGAAAIRDAPQAQGISPVEWLPVRGGGPSPKIWLQDFLRAYPELAKAFPGEAGWDHQWYALARIESDCAQAAELRLCGNDGCQVWWNGRFVFEEHSWHKLAFDLHIIPVRLKRGRNTLLLKLDRYGLLARITAPGGGALPGKVRVLAAAEPRPNPPGTFEQLARVARTRKVFMPCRATSAAEHARWRRAAQAHYHTCLGTFPRLPAKRTRITPVEQVACDSYTRFRYHLPREAGSILPVYVLVPDAARRNGRTVICPHGHGQDDKVVAGVEPPAAPRSNWCGPFSGNYAGQLAQAGFVTATWSARAMSRERNDAPAGAEPCNTAGLAAQAMGMTLPGLHLFDLHGVAAFTGTLAGVDPKRMGLTGLSGGGTLSCLAAAYDDRFAAAAIFCGLCSYEDYAATAGCAMQVVPGLYPTLNTGELLCLAAPRPLLLAQGRRDVTFNEFRLQRFAREARRAYRALGHADRVETCVYDLAHQVNIEAAIDFFTRRL
jgi:dienelactone hydrolase